MQSIPVPHIECIFNALFQLFNTIFRGGISGERRKGSVGERLSIVYHTIGSQFGAFPFIG